MPALAHLRELSLRVTPLRRSINAVRGAADLWTDRRWNVDTIGLPESMTGGQIKRRGRHGDRKCYEPIRYSILFKYLKPLRPSDQDVVFDIGSGLGRALHVFSRLGVRRCIGIEIVDELARAARDNARRLRGRKCPIETRVQDAATADYDDGTIYLFFNPFGAATLRAVLGRINQTLAAKPRRIQIAYFTPCHEDVLRSCPWLTLTGRKCSTLHSVEVSYWTNRHAG